MLDITSKVKAIIADKLFIEESEISSNSHFYDDLGADDLDFVELLIEFEMQFDIHIPDAIAETLLTVEQMISFIEKQK